MARLNAATRRALPASDFAEPGKRGYPIEDKGHAEAALSEVSQHGTPAEKREVRSAVHRRYPNMGNGGATGQSTEPVQKEQVQGSPLRKGMKRRAPAATMEQDGGGAAQPKGSPMAWRKK